MKSVDIKSDQMKRREAATEFLRGLLSRAEAGEIDGVTVIMEHPGERYSIEGSASLSRLQTIGALFESAVMRACQ